MTSYGSDEFKLKSVKNQSPLKYCSLKRVKTKLLKLLYATEDEDESNSTQKI